MTDRHGSCCRIAREGIEAPDRVPSAGVRRGAAAAAIRWSRLDGGAFTMGTSGREGFPGDGEGPARRVRLSPFSIAVHAVTNRQFGAFVRDTGHVTEAERFNWSYVFHALVPEAVRRRVVKVPAETPWWLPVSHAYWAQPEGPGSTVLDRLDHPVVHVSWNDAKAYCAWSGTRLPTEAEWEFAARGGLENRLYPWGDELTPGGEHRCNIWQGEFPVVNTLEDGYLGTAPADAYAPNGYGLHNMAGNVWEWCEDDFSPDYHRATSDLDPLYRDGTLDRSMRGGSFLCHASYCNRYRVAARNSNAADSSASNIGFRVVQSAS